MLGPAWSPKAACSLPDAPHRAARLQTRASEASAAGKLDGSFVTLCRWRTLATGGVAAAWNDWSQFLDKVAADTYKK
jgi:hypothetical protein